MPNYCLLSTITTGRKNKVTKYPSGYLNDRGEKTWCQRMHGLFWFFKFTPELNCKSLFWMTRLKVCAAFSDAMFMQGYSSSIQQIVIQQTDSSKIFILGIRKEIHPYRNYLSTNRMRRDFGALRRP